MNKWPPKDYPYSGSAIGSASSLYDEAKGQPSWVAGPKREKADELLDFGIEDYESLLKFGIITAAQDTILNKYWLPCAKEVRRGLGGPEVGMFVYPKVWHSFDSVRPCIFNGLRYIKGDLGPS